MISQLRTGRRPRPDQREPDQRERAVGFGPASRWLAFALSLTIVSLLGAGGAQSASAQASSNPFGALKVSRVVGAAANGATFAGTYNVQRFVVRNNKLEATGRLAGTLTRKGGKTQHVSKAVRMPVDLAATKTALKTNLPGPAANNPAANNRAANNRAAVTPPVSCQVLDLVLGPLDLDLLGLRVHLDRVHLNITAVPGAGALLGNLLCAVAGLLDGTGLGGLNGILANLLNAILGILQA